MGYERISTPSERLKIAMDLKQITKAELSELSGINKPSITCYVSGKYEPKQEALYRLGKALNVSEMWIAGYDVPMEKRQAGNSINLPTDLSEEDITIIDMASKMTPEGRKSLIEYMEFIIAKQKSSDK